MGEAVHTGVTMIADGSEEADLRLEACLTTDSGIGVVRHAQAGYPMARQVAEGQGPLTADSIKVPLWWTPAATFGPEGGDAGPAGAAHPKRGTGLTPGRRCPRLTPHPRRHGR